MKLRSSVRCICVAIVIAIGLLANESTARLIIEDPIIGNFSLETSQYYWRGTSRDRDVNLRIKFGA